MGIKQINDRPGQRKKVNIHQILIMCQAPFPKTWKCEEALSNYEYTVHRNPVPTHSHTREIHLTIYSTKLVKQIMLTPTVLQAWNKL